MNEIDRTFACEKGVTRGKWLYKSITEYFRSSTGRMGWMSHRKWKKTKEQPSMLPGPALPGCCLISFNFLWAIHPIRPVQTQCLKVYRVIHLPLRINGGTSSTQKLCPGQSLPSEHFAPFCPPSDPVDAAFNARFAIPYHTNSQHRRRSERTTSLHRHRSAPTERARAKTNKKGTASFNGRVHAVEATAVPPTMMEPAQVTGGEGS